MHTITLFGGKCRRALIAACLLFFCAAGWSPTAFAYNILEECLALTSADDEIHACLDNYLDVMDDNIADISAFVARDLTGTARARFQRAQQTFFEYRKENCLWYLEFSSPRGTAEQIAKQCLATMSQQRLAELQGLMAADADKKRNLIGFYVYGSNRNSFQPCGSEFRYWVEGEESLVGQLQQDYLTKATADLQVMYVIVQGALDDQVQSYSGHNGVLNLTDIRALRVPSENDCRLPSNFASGPIATTESLAPVATAAEISSDEQSNDEPEQVLRAYFGAWFAECTQQGKVFRCDVSVEFTGDTVTPGFHPKMKLNRSNAEKTLVELSFPDREIDSPAKIRWKVDRYGFGDIVGSEIRVDEIETRQIVSERKFIRDDLMPLLIKGGEVSVEVLEDVDDSSGEKFVASLKGLTRALAFADDFVTSGGKL